MESLLNGRKLKIAIIKKKVDLLISKEKRILSLARIGSFPKYRHREEQQADR